MYRLAGQLKDIPLQPLWAEIVVKRLYYKRRIDIGRNHLLVELPTYVPADNFVGAREYFVDDGRMSVCQFYYYPVTNFWHICCFEFVCSYATQLCPK